MDYVKQNFVAGQKLRADQMNHIEDGIVAALATYYNTEREDIEEAHEDITSEYIFGLYNALVANDPYDRVKKIEHTVGDFTNFEYVISTGEYSTEGMYAKDVYSPDPHIKKPKYLILSGIHGNERQATLSTYRFIRDVLSGHNVPQAFREGAIISVMPVGTPSAFNAYQRQNDKGVDSEGVVIKGVDINRNFPHDGEWKQEWFDGDEDGKLDCTNGSSAASEKETQAIMNWLSANTDAELFIDHHNSGRLNEKVAVMGMSDDTDAELARKIALRGVDRIIPFWKEVIGCHDTAVTKGNVTRDVIYSYSAKIDLADSRGKAFAYAHNVLGIRSIAIETCHYYGDWNEYQNHEANLKNNPSETYYQPEVIAMGAEALGNILIEFYAQSCEVIAMSNIDGKLDSLLKQVNSGFHIETGSVAIESDLIPTGTSTTAKLDGGFTINDFPADAKLVVFEADEDTHALIMAKSDRAYTIGVTCNFADQVTGGEKNCISTTNAKGTMSYGGIAATNIDGVFNTECYAMLAGKYRWTAYCWND